MRIADEQVRCGNGPRGGHSAEVPNDALRAEDSLSREHSHVEGRRKRREPEEDKVKRRWNAVEHAVCAAARLEPDDHTRGDRREPQEQHAILREAYLSLLAADR